MIRSRQPSIIVIVLSGLVPCAASHAQTVQQPVFGVTSVNTTVSVPDRGSALLGSISRAADSRRTYGFGPFRPGSNRGLDRSHTSISTSVFIHDFQAMDEAILNGGAGTDSTSSGRLDRSAARRYADQREFQLRRLTSARLRSRELLTRNTESPEPTPPVAATAPEPVESKADRYLRLGRESVAAGKLSVAKLHFRAAERLGATEAAAELQSLKTLSTRTQTSGR